MGNKNVKQTVPNKDKTADPSADFSISSFYERDVKQLFSSMKWKNENTSVPLKSIQVVATVGDH